MSGSYQFFDLPHFGTVPVFYLSGLNIHCSAYILNNKMNNVFIILVKNGRRQMRTELLYWYFNSLTYESIPNEHCHPYWQMEVLIYGLLRIGPVKGLREFHAPAIVVISPETPHTVQKKSGEGEALSIKLQVDDHRLDHIGIFSVPDDDFCLWLQKTVAEMIANEKQNPEQLIRNLHVLEHLASAFFEHLAECVSENKPKEPQLFTRLREIVLTMGRAANIDSAAEQLKCTPAHLKYIFRCTSEQFPELHAGSSVKNFMDLICAEMIERYLKYSKLPVGKIAEASGFPDIYKFSRFYRRMRSRSPSEFRKNPEAQ